MKKIFNYIKNDSGFKLSAICAIAVLLICQAQRLALFVSFSDFFSGISLGRALSCFAKGFIFDASICASAFGIPILLMNIPGMGKKWLKGNAAFFTALFMAFAILLAADYLYFPEMHRHIAEELKWAANEFLFFVSYAFTKALPELIGVIALSSLIFYALFSFINYNERKINKEYKKKPATYHAAKLFLLAAAIFLLQRGGFVRKNVGVADVFKYARTNEEAVLVMNGVFSAVNISRKKTLTVKNDFPYEDALSIIKPRILSKGEKWTGGENFPLERVSERELEKGKKLNIFFVMLEAWKTDYIDSISGGKNGDTPNFDKLAKEGLLFTNAYATGTRSIYGFAGIFASLPLVPGLPVFGYGLELNSFSPIFRLFSEKGYQTTFTQASHSDSYRMCSLALAMGADGAWGWEHLPMRLDYSFTPDYGYDYEALQFAADKAQEASKKGKNFLASAFTATTHAPFGKLLADGRFSKYPNDTWEHGFRNSLAYSDWSIGQIIKRAKEEGWFDDTIFIFMSDHNQHIEGNSDRDAFRVPLLIYSPKHIKPGKRDYVVSQLDILPTLAEIGGIKQHFSSAGRSILDESRPEQRFALISYGGDDFGIITADGLLRHNMQKTVSFENKSGKADEKQLEKMALAAHKIFHKTLRENRWARK